MINVRNIDVYYGKVQALSDISIEVQAQEIVAIIGANGAGKSTLLKAISGELHPIAGQIEFDGKRIDHLAPDKIVKLGLVHVPEGKRLFPALTVMENLMMGAYSLAKQNQRIGACLEYIFELFPALEERKKQYAGSLSGGEQQMLAISRGLMADAKALLIDEPSLGLAPILVDQVFNAIKEINEQRQKTILLVEQNVESTLAFVQRAYVFEEGRIVLAGGARELLNKEEVKKAYLGIK